MIVDLPNTTTNAINHKLVDLRNSGGRWRSAGC
jgi:hypothetical protein